MGIEFTSKEMTLIVSILGFRPDTIMMNLMRYAKRGLLTRRRVGHEYFYSTNDSTWRAYQYFFGCEPPMVVKTRVAPGDYFPLQTYDDMLRAGMRFRGYFV